MSGLLVDGKSWNLLNHGAGWGVTSSPPPGEMAPPAVGKWATFSSTAGAATDFTSGSPSSLQLTSQPNVAAAPSWAFDKQAPFAHASEKQLHIFCLDEGGRPRMTYRRPEGNGGLLSVSRRHAGKQSPAPSPPKFELAAVAALCSPESRPPPPRARAPKPFRFPSAHSFVPGRQLPLGNAAAGPTENDPPGACTIRRPDRAVKKDLSPEMFTSFTGLPALGQRGPLEAHCEKGMQQTEGGVLGMGPLQQSSGGSGGSLPRCSSPYMSRSPAPLWSDRQPGVDSMRNPYGSVLHHPEQVSAQTTGPANGSCTQFPPGASIAEFSHWGESCRQPPSLLKGQDSTVRQAVFAEGCNSRSFLPPMKPWQATTPRSTEKAEEFNYDQRAEVVTVYGTDRFWDLMETLAELKAGPTSLLSSSVTFDSVLLPGGELQYSVIEEGSFGKVFVGSHQGTKVAIKVPVDCMLSTDPAGVMERTLNEWRILSVCQHPNVVRLIGGIVHGPFDVWLVTQLVNGSDLHSRKYSRDPLVRRFISPENGLHMCRQLAAVVAYLHTPVPGIKPIVVHRDIKPENVLIADDWTIRLCDFGDAEASADGRVSRVSGATWFYAPAELLRCSPVEFMASNPGRQLPPLNEKWDIWSMGCVFQEMFGFFNPMHVHISSRDSPSVIYEKLKSKAIAGALVPHIAEEIQGVARNIILRCLDPDPSARPSAMEVLKMWSAPDEYILKDIRTRRNHPHANVVETSSLNITKWQRFPGIIPEPLHLLPNIGSPPAETSIQFRSGDNIGNAVRGQLHPAASAGASAGASPGPAGALLLENRERDNWVANASNASAPFPVIPATSLVAKEGARVVQPQGFVQSQGLWPAAGWQ